MSHLFEIASAATSREEIGNPVYPPVKRLLESRGISCEGKKAVQIQPEDYDYYDYIIGAESVNVENIKRITGGDPKMKIYRLLDFTREPRDIADPWYTGDFQTAYDETEEGCFSLLNILQPGGIFGEDGFSCSSHSDPVSYTHLDVYKRQLLLYKKVWTVPRAWRKSFANNLRTGPFRTVYPPCIPDIPYAPVSYTHLDVYKRQGQCM